MFENTIESLSDDKLKEHMKGLVPNDLKYWSNNGYTIFYILSSLDRTAIVLSAGGGKNHEELNGQALDELFKFT